MTARVFIADDHAIVRDGLRLLLEARGDVSVVGEASDGREALKKVPGVRPDVVIMDIAMPLMNGIEATRRICRFWPEIKVIILSMYYTTEHLFRAFEAGAAGYLLKESAGSEVVDAVMLVRRGRRYLCKKISPSVLDSPMKKRHRGKSPLETLSAREREVLQLIVEGSTSAEVAALLALSPKSVETYRSRLMKKLGVHDMPGLIRFAIRHGLTAP